MGDWGFKTKLPQSAEIEEKGMLQDLFDRTFAISKERRSGHVESHGIELFRNFGEEEHPLIVFKFKVAGEARLKIIEEYRLRIADNGYVSTPTLSAAGRSGAVITIRLFGDFCQISITDYSRKDEAEVIDLMRKHLGDLEKLATPSRREMVNSAPFERYSRLWDGISRN